MPVDSGFYIMASAVLLVAALLEPLYSPYNILVMHLAPAAAAAAMY